MIASNLAHQSSKLQWNQPFSLTTFECFFFFFAHCSQLICFVLWSSLVVLMCAVPVWECVCVFCVRVCHDLDLANWQAEFITTLVSFLYIKFTTVLKKIHFFCAPGLQTRHDSIVLPQRQYRRSHHYRSLSFCSRYCYRFLCIVKSVYHHYLPLSYRCFLRYMYIVINSHK